MYGTRTYTHKLSYDGNNIINTCTRTRSSASISCDVSGRTIFIELRFEKEYARVRTKHIFRTPFGTRRPVKVQGASWRKCSRSRERRESVANTRGRQRERKIVRRRGYSTRVEIDEKRSFAGAFAPKKMGPFTFGDISGTRGTKGH